MKNKTTPVAPKYVLKVVRQMLGGYRWHLYDHHDPIVSGFHNFDRAREAMSNWRKIKKTLGITVEVEEFTDA